MADDNIKLEINKALDHLSDNALNGLIQFLKQFESKKNNTFLNSNDFQKILSEDKQLLEKLAQ